MADPNDLRRAALRAALAVTFGVGSLALGACTEDDSSEPGEDVVPVDASGDVEADGTTTSTAPDATTSTSPDATTSTSDAVADTGSDASSTCSATADGVCPAECSESNDFDCCGQIGGMFGGGCAIPGPFVPPTVRV